MKKKEKSEKNLPSSAAGIIALVFLVIGYETALFIHKAAVTEIAREQDSPDTVYIVTHEYPTAGHCESKTDATKILKKDTIRRNSSHSPVVQKVRSQMRRVENFSFNPNTASLEDFQRLGFSQKQASSIINYREKGGRFRRREDFRKSFAVSDSIFKRLEKYIYIPLIDLNKADSAEFDQLPGIGGWFASQMVKRREELGGYSNIEQLLDIYNFDKEKFDGLKDLVSVGKPRPYRLWSLPADSLKMHPYIKDMRTAKAIVLFRENTPKEELSVEGLRKAGILTQSQAEKLARCSIAEP